MNMIFKRGEAEKSSYLIPSGVFLLFLYFLNWKITALQYCVGFCQTSALISHRYTYVPSLLKPPPALFP